MLAQLKVLTVSSEPGGAKNLVAVAQEFNEVAVFKNCCSRGAVPVFKASGLKYEQAGHINKLSDAVALLQTVRPDVILSGRGIDPASFERRITRAAQTLQVPCIGVIDEWYDYRKNYEDASGNLTGLPDIVCCPDNQARQEAIHDGLPVDILHVTGSPALASVFDQRERYQNLKPAGLNPVSREGEGPVIVFLSEIIRPELVGSPASQHGEGPGYSEHSVRESLRDCLEGVFGQFSVIEKLHPSSGMQDYPALGTKTIGWQTVKDKDLGLLFWQADIVVGMRTAALIEAWLFGTATVSFQPGLIGENRCTAVRKRLIPCFSQPGSLEEWLRSQSFERKMSLVARPGFACREAAGNVFSVLENLAVRH